MRFKIFYDYDVHSIYRSLHEYAKEYNCSKRYLLVLLSFDIRFKVLHCDVHSTYR